MRSAYGETDVAVSALLSRVEILQTAINRTASTGSVKGLGASTTDFINAINKTVMSVFGATLLTLGTRDTE